MYGNTSEYDNGMSQSQMTDHGRRDTRLHTNNGTNV